MESDLCLWVSLVCDYCLVLRVCWLCSLCWLGAPGLRGLCRRPRKHPLLWLSCHSREPFLKKLHKPHLLFPISFSLYLLDSFSPCQDSVIACPAYVYILPSVMSSFLSWSPGSWLHSDIISGPHSWCVPFHFQQFLVGRDVFLFGMPGDLGVKYLIKQWQVWVVGKFSLGSTEGKQKADLLLAKMKFMKLGSKPDSFQTDGNNVRWDLLWPSIWTLLCFFLDYQSELVIWLFSDTFHIMFRNPVCIFLCISFGWFFCSW